MTLTQKVLAKHRLLVLLVMLFFKVISLLIISIEKIFDKIPSPVPEEEDLLDLAYGLTETSRLGC